MCERENGVLVLVCSWRVRGVSSAWGAKIRGLPLAPSLRRGAFPVAAAVSFDVPGCVAGFWALGRGRRGKWDRPPLLCGCVGPSQGAAAGGWLAHAGLGTFRLWDFVVLACGPGGLACVLWGRA